MQFIKVGDRIINLNAIASVNLKDRDNFVRIDLLVSSGDSNDFASEPLYFKETAEMEALRAFFSNPTNAHDILK